MLPKKNRLNLTTDFDLVASGKKVSGQLVKLFYILGNNLQPKVGIAISSKKFRKSVERNRVKRLIATAFEKVLSKIANNANIIVMPKEQILNLAEIEKELQTLLEKEGLLK